MLLSRRLLFLRHCLTPRFKEIDPLFGFRKSFEINFKFVSNPGMAHRGNTRISDELLKKIYDYSTSPSRAMRPAHSRAKVHVRILYTRVDCCLEINDASECI